MSAKYKTPNPSGCGRCGIDERDHSMSWDRHLGEYHTWEEPTLQQRRERMFARHFRRSVGETK